MNPGDTYDYSFTLQFQNLLVCESPCVASSYAIASTSSLGPGDSYRVELFEDNLSQAPLNSCLIGYAQESKCAFPAAWQEDAEGVVRLTAVSGSVVLDSIYVRVTIPGLDPFRGTLFVAAVEVVPEPSGLAIGSVAGISVLGWSILRKVRRSKKS
jgi:hypothetical protein